MSSKEEKGWCPREEEASQVALHHRKRADLGPIPLDEFVLAISAEIGAKSDV
jgi:hypothetical protein